MPFLVAAGFLFHHVVGNAGSLSDMWKAMRVASWWMPAGATLCWFAGLKFLLSFSILRRRHLPLGERFDPFFFKTPFWRYLGFLLLTYAWLLLVAALLAVLGPATLLHAVLIVAELRIVLSTRIGVTLAGITLPDALGAALAIGVVAVNLLLAWFAIRMILRQVPFFTILALDPPRPAWRDAVRAMRGSAWRYFLRFVLAMLPIAVLDLLLDAVLTHVGAGRHAAPVALGEAAFRQAMLFVHVSLGLPLGAITTITVLPKRPDGAGR